jgi:DHA1 family putative efflux transporter-like MFS transporter
MYRWTIYILTLGVFVTATSELIVSGILPVIAAHMNVTLALAGQLVTVYSLAFAIGTPIIVALTSRLSRKKLLIGSLLLFIFGSLLASISLNMWMLISARVLLGTSAGVYLVVVFSTAAKIVPAAKIGSAIGTIVLGFSSAMILGVPIGIAITNWLNWQAIFLMLGLFSVLIAVFIVRLVPDIEGDAPTSFRQQWKVVGSVAIASGLLVTFFRESGNSVLFTYLLPYLETIVHMKASYSGAVMLVLGIFGAIGSRLGGYGVDRWGAVRVLTVAMIVDIVVVALLPLSSNSAAGALLLIAFMVLAMFVGGPALQSYFIQQAPQSSNLVLSLNTSVIHLGLAAGAGAGGVLVDTASTLAYHPWLTSSVLVIGLGAALISFSARGTGARPVLGHSVE